MLNTIHQWLVYFGINSVYAAPLTRIIATGLVILISWAAYALMRKLVLQTVSYSVKRSKIKWDDILLQKKFFRRLANLAPALIVYLSAPVLLDGLPGWIAALQQGAVIYMIAWGTLAVSAFFSAVLAIYDTLPASKGAPINGLIQALQIITFLLGGIIALASLLGETPLYFLSGLGAFTAVLMLVFKDPLLGFVAGIQLSANKMVARNDWISMPDFGADGEVLEVGLTTVKVQNWDKTITTIPTYALISNSFKNWRGMQESDGRRIKRALYLDLTSIGFLTDDQLTQLGAVDLLRDYLHQKQTDIARYNTEHNITPGSPINGRRLTNIGTFRAYIDAYLQHHPLVNRNMTLMVRQLDPTPHGLPLELYLFSADKTWVNYEILQADIFDHLLAAAPHFGLRVYQYPTAADIQGGYTCAPDGVTAIAK